MSIADSPCPINGEAAATTASAPDTRLSKSAFPLVDRIPRKKTRGLKRVVNWAICPRILSRDSKTNLEQEGIRPESALHRPEEKYSEFFDEPLKYSIVKAELDEGHEKYDRLNSNEVSNSH